MAIGRVNGVVGVAAVADTDVGVEPHSARGGQWVVGVDQAALGPLEVPQRQAVRYAAEEERRLPGCEDAGGHRDFGCGGKELGVSRASFWY